MLEKVARSGPPFVREGGKPVPAKAGLVYRNKAELVAELRGLWPSGVAQLTVTPRQKEPKE